jgi:hypothetical protein
MARGSHELPKVSLGPALPYPSSPCGRSPENGLMAVSGVATHRVGGLWQSATPLDTQPLTPLRVIHHPRPSVGDVWMVMTGCLIRIL